MNNFYTLFYFNIFISTIALQLKKEKNNAKECE